VKLSLEMLNRGDVIILHCQGRVVYRDEAAALARVAGSLLEQTEKLVIDLSGVTAIDSAGLGELALLYSRARERNASLKYAGASRVVAMLLGLTNLDRVLDVHPSVELALEAFRDERVCAEC
jgi:anti-sigma B factor antagonist